MTNGLNTHSFEGPTTINFGHRHFYRGSTSADPNTPGHVHQISDITTFNDGHSHRISVTTGPSILVNNGHVHRYTGTTSYDDGHVHYFTGYTSVYPR
ncbi:MAG TPA: hypothetical protein GX396_03480 [Tissierellia bacterium]|nr:hypothetical protein [Tissierellia bacterium]